MSVDGEDNSTAGFDTSDHQVNQFKTLRETILSCVQPAYIFTPFATSENAREPPTKRRRVTKSIKAGNGQNHDPAFQFESLLNGLESLQCVNLRQQLFIKNWGETEERIQVGLTGWRGRNRILKDVQGYFGGSQ